MRVLALETSGTVGSVALLEQIPEAVQLIDQIRLPEGERSARTLLPAVHAMLAEHSWRPADIGLVCTTTGPGSFTGLRIGVVAAKTFAYATGAKLVGVHTLAAIAEGVGAGSQRVWTVLDAQRGELFVACFPPGSDLADTTQPATEILNVDAWLERLAAGDVVTVPPLAKCCLRLPAGVIVAPASAWAPTAASVGRLAVALERRGAVVDPLALVPNYYRKSAAEEKAPR